ncbi:homeobox-leucine zipper HAT9-like [Olea europaea subsp. europaea]|uniref:Homeobox-leucine zipper HAT9-like n=1 Tax=Olea europaea subsp. europaea TaxID=158383 RepID=A0A8S0SPC7_OLEEU|nr:homeobox-leucine zipper HAT9-like [Olea europaea subsp. europaea]
MANRFEKHQNDALKLAFEESVHLTKEKKTELVRATGLDMEQVTSWFNRKRARKRARESKMELEQTMAELHQALQESQEKEARLQKELQESRGREAELEAENQQLKQRLTITEGDLQFDSVLKFLKGHP